MKASKCPFLAAEMSQKNSGVVRQIGIEFQEDVQEVRTVKKGEVVFFSFCFFSLRTKSVFHSFVQYLIAICFCPDRSAC